MKLLAAMLAACLACASAYAHPRLELGLGESQYSLMGNDAWWQSTFPNYESVDPTAWQLGVQDGFATWDGFELGGRVAWVDLGTVHSAATWTTDANWYRHSRSGPYWAGDSSWSAYGLSFGPTVSHDLGPVVGQIEGGLFVYRSGGQMNWQTLSDDSTSGTYVVPYSWHSTPYVGFSMRYGVFSVSYRIYQRVETKSGSQVGLLGGGPAQTVVLGISYGF